MDGLFKSSLCRKAFILMLVIICKACMSLAQEPRPGMIVAGFFEEWGNQYTGFSIADLEKNQVAGELTHLIYAFADVTVDPAPACVIPNPILAYQDTSVPSVSGKPYPGPLFGNFAAIRQLKQLHPHLRVLISLGGQAGNGPGFSRAAATAEGRAKLASACIDMFVKGNIGAGVRAPGLFDGFNIDWEYPTAADKINFTALLKEFRTQLDALTRSSGEHYILSFDSPAGPQNFINVDLKAAAAQVDFLTIDGYDYAGSWDKQTNEVSPLFESDDNPLKSQAFSIDETVQAYLRAGVPPSKYTMGIPAYAAGWTGVPNVNHGLYQNSTALSPVLLADGSGLCPHPGKAAPSPGCDPILAPGLLAYSTVEMLIDRNGYTAWYDAARVGATLFNPAATTFYSYDDPRSVSAKTVYIRKNRLGGAYIWALNYDDSSGSLTKAVAKQLK